MAEKYFFGWFDNKWSNPLNWSSEWNGSTVINASVPTSADNVYLIGDYTSASPTGFWAGEVEFDLPEISIKALYPANQTSPGQYEFTIGQ